MERQAGGPHHDEGAGEGVRVGGGVVEGSDGAAVLGRAGAGGPPVMHPLGGPLLRAEAGDIRHVVVAQYVAHLFTRPADVLLALQPVAVPHRLHTQHPRIISSQSRLPSLKICVFPTPTVPKLIPQDSGVQCKSLACCRLANNRKCNNRRSPSIDASSGHSNTRRQEHQA